MQDDTRAEVGQRCSGEPAVIGRHPKAERCGRLWASHHLLKDSKHSQRTAKVFHIIAKCRRSVNATVQLQCRIYHCMQKVCSVGSTESVESRWSCGLASATPASKLVGLHQSEVTHSLNLTSAILHHVSQSSSRRGSIDQPCISRWTAWHID